jgi:hypothetical protein
MLKAIGFWIMDFNDEGQPSPQELVGSMPGDLRERLADYLAAGLTYQSYCGWSWCRFGCGIKESGMGDSELTDGTWVWPEALEHYVREHGIVLPEEFVTHTLSGPPPKQPLKVEVGISVLRVSSLTAPLLPFANEEVDTEFWVRWAASRRKPEFLERLRAAHAAAELLVSEAKAELAAPLVGEKRSSEANCAFHDCNQMVLSGDLLCARHRLELSPLGPEVLEWRLLHSSFRHFLRRLPIPA